ncbi:formate/nitrite transporter family protein [Rhodobacterales bacterium HKCCE3408]|nr:formate/nitrite transporter family protein [Rhodobacterales bacterium HKCCE3408]
MQEETVEEAASLSSKLVYEVIRREGEQELARTTRSLAYAGLSAGVLIGFSLVAEAILRSYLPDAPWRHLIENFGYSLGFALVILGRMQLFTENTITTVLPLMRKFTPNMFLQVARLWAIVLGTNVIGAFIAGAWLHYAPTLPDQVMPSIYEISHHAVDMGALESFVRAIPAGLLVAAIVWMMPQVEPAPLAVIVLFTWLIAAGDFAHVIVGSVEMTVVILDGALAPLTAITQFWLPVLFGNIVGGTAIFTLMAWGQVRDDLNR